MASLVTALRSGRLMLQARFTDILLTFDVLLHVICYNKTILINLQCLIDGIDLTLSELSAIIHHIDSTH